MFLDLDRFRFLSMCQRY